MTNPHKTVLLIRANGRTRTVSIDRDAHTLTFDIQTLEKFAIAEFVNKFIEAFELGENIGGISSISRSSLIGIAVGYYQIDVQEFYPKMENIYQLDDKTLVSVFRWANKREKDLQDDSRENSDQQG